MIDILAKFERNLMIRFMGELMDCVNLKMVIMLIRCILCQITQIQNFNIQ